MTPHSLDLLRAHLRYGTAEAAQRMGLSEQTVKNSLTALYRELDVKSAAQAAIALGWLRLDDLDARTAIDRQPAVLVRLLLGRREGGLRAAMGRVA